MVAIYSRTQKAPWQLAMRPNEHSNNARFLLERVDAGGLA
jgi:hypothetical protein